MNGIKLISTGSAVPKKVVTNDDLAKIVDTNDEWISTRTGVPWSPGFLSAPVAVVPMSTSCHAESISRRQALSVSAPRTCSSP